MWIHLGAHCFLMQIGKKCIFLWAAQYVTVAFRGRKSCHNLEHFQELSD